MIKKIGFQAFLGTNYGTILQTFALYCSIKKLGYKCEIIGCNEFRKRENPDQLKISINSKEYDAKLSALTCETFYKDKFVFNEILGKIPLNASLSKAQKFELAKFDAFICGSDQIWKPYGFWFHAKRYLQYAPVEKRISYAPSIGWKKIEIRAVGNIPLWRTWLKSIKYLSTREKNGSDIVAKLTGRFVQTVLDPTLLLTSLEWDSLTSCCVFSKEINEILSKNKPYLVAYLLDTYDIYKDAIIRFANDNNFEIVWLTGRDNVGPIQRNIATTDPAGFVQLIKNASFVFVDGYHGSCFSLNFSKPFILLTRENKIINDVRMNDIFERLNVQHRVVKNPHEIINIDLTMDYTLIQNQLSKEREISWKYLSSSLEEASKNKIYFYKKITRAISYIKNIFIKNRMQNKNNTDTIQCVAINNIDSCTGCGACKNVCPQNAISMNHDKKGFLIPVVNLNICINCGKCLRSCPIQNRPSFLLREKPESAYALWSTDQEILARSSSGGAFTVLSSYILERSGVVFGVAWDKDINAKTVSANSKDDIIKICGSKYVQSDTMLTYRDVKNNIDNGIPVLYSGTSCQIAGLYGYLGSDHDLLLTVDLLCSGVPSPMIFKKYIDWREREKKSKIINVEFRSKRRNGWGQGMVLHFENGQTSDFQMQNDEYGILFLRHFIQRESCYNCKFRGIDKRLADITIGDFWGIGKHGDVFNHQTRQGVSVLLCNSEKGKNILNNIIKNNDNIFSEKRKLEEVYHGNAWILKNFPKHINYHQLFSLFELNSFEKAFDEYFGDENIRYKIKI